MAPKRDFLSFADLSRPELLELLTLAAEMKRGLYKEKPLAEKAVGLVFAKSSTRTRVSFEVGVHQLGGQPLFLSSDDIQLGRGEPIRDTARVLSRFLDCLMIRTYGHAEVEELARFATIPVINGLTDLVHPAQVLADLMTLREKRGDLSQTTVAFVGDGNNVVNSWLNAAALFGLRFRLACPPGYEPDARILAHAQSAAPGNVEILNDPAAAAKDADVVYTDVWTSMGQEAETQARRAAFADYQVNAALLRHARPDALVMHCLPAHRGDEITADVLDGPNSVVLDQAENRLHAQKALMAWLAARSTPQA
jgi:ornithine carbamoyltransferase